MTNINTEKSLQDIVRSIVMLSKSLGITNIFEGVENEQELTQVRQLEARYIQGYLFSRPLEIEELDSWFDTATKQRIA